MRVIVGTIFCILIFLFITAVTGNLWGPLPWYAQICMLTPMALFSFGVSLLIVKAKFGCAPLLDEPPLPDVEEDNEDETEQLP